MTTQEFLKYWTGKYGDCPPLGYLMRATFGEIWFRIHTLPDSKQYAETPNEENEIIKRHNAVLSSLFVEGSQFFVVSTEYSLGLETDPVPPKLSDVLGAVPQYIYTAVDKDLEPEDDTHWHFYFTSHSWSNGCMDKLLRMVATEEVSDILLVGVQQACAYHPYDGGADVFIWDAEKRTATKNQFKYWLPIREDGL